MKQLIAVLAILAIPFSLGACADNKPTSEKKDTKYTNQINKKLKAAVGYPDVKDSLELRNLKSRYERLDERNKVGYVYLISHGLVFAEYTVKGKVSSLGSQFTNPLQGVDCGTDCAYTISQSEPDGSYGDNPEGIFFFTTDNVYVEWAGDYAYADERLEIQQPSVNIIAKQVK